MPRREARLMADYTLTELMAVPRPRARLATARSCLPARACRCWARCWHNTLTRPTAASSSRQAAWPPPRAPAYVGWRPTHAARRSDRRRAERDFCLHVAVQPVGQWALSAARRSTAMATSTARRLAPITAIPKYASLAAVAGPTSPAWPIAPSSSPSMKNGWFPGESRLHR